MDSVYLLMKKEETMGRIDVTDVDLKKLIKTAYDLSVPFGLGCLHYREGNLSDEEVDSILDKWKKDKSRIVVDLDYVHGRACKLTVLKCTKTGRLFIYDSWYDHNEEDLKKLLEAVGITKPRHI